MKCPKCGHSTTKHGISKTQQSKDANAIRRLRWCAKCRKVFVTYEVIVDEQAMRELGLDTFDFIDTK